MTFPAIFKRPSILLTVYQLVTLTLDIKVSFILRHALNNLWLSEYT